MMIRLPRPAAGRAAPRAYTVRKLALLAVAALGLGLGLTPSPAAAQKVRAYRHTCAAAPARGYAACFALVATVADSPRTQPKPLVTTAPAGYGPADLASAYDLGAAAGQGAGRTVAIVDAQDDPNAESDLGIYRSQYGLPACTTANGCLRKVNENGQASPLPTGDTGWGTEISLDLDMVSAICPSCHILLVEASSASDADLGTAVNTAASLGATEISNSWGGGEDSTVTGLETKYFNHPGIDITASSGDSGYGVSFPASSRFVTAVGGTSLSRASNARGWSETVWNGAGSGCSQYIVKPTWQTDAGCANRTVADVAAIADPNTGVAVYDTYGGARAGAGGWEIYGGTSVGAPLVASVWALAGGRSPGTTYGSFAYSNPSLFYDVTSGSNGSCGGSYLCTAKVGYDGPTGIGTPNGAGTPGPPPPPQAPVNTAVPTIAGTPAQGQRLSASTGSWTGSPTPTYGYQWSQCASASACASCPTACTAIVGATSSSYVLGAGDVGHFVTVTVTATNTGGTASQSAAGVGPVMVPPPPASFTLGASPSSGSLSRLFGSASFTITLTPQNGFNGSVTLAASGLPSGASASFSPNPTSSRTSTLTISSGFFTRTGTYAVKVTGTSGSLSASTTLTVTIR